MSGEEEDSRAPAPVLKRATKNASLPAVESGRTSLFREISEAEFRKAKWFGRAFAVFLPSAGVIGAIAYWVTPYFFGSRELFYGIVISAVFGSALLWNKGFGLLKTKPYQIFADNRKMEKFRARQEEL